MKFSELVEHGNQITTQFKNTENKMKSKTYLAMLAISIKKMNDSLELKLDENSDDYNKLKELQKSFKNLTDLDIKDVPSNLSYKSETIVKKDNNIITNSSSSFECNVKLNYSKCDIKSLEGLKSKFEILSNSKDYRLEVLKAFMN